MPTSSQLFCEIWWYSDREQIAQRTWNKSDTGYLRASVFTFCGSFWFSKSTFDGQSLPLHSLKHQCHNHLGWTFHCLVGLTSMTQIYLISGPLMKQVQWRYCTRHVRLMIHSICLHHITTYPHAESPGHLKPMVHFVPNIVITHAHRCWPAQLWMHFGLRVPHLFNLHNDKHWDASM